MYYVVWVVFYRLKTNGIGIGTKEYDTVRAVPYVTSCILLVIFVSVHLLACAAAAADTDSIRFDSTLLYTLPLASIALASYVVATYRRRLALAHSSYFEAAIIGFTSAQRNNIRVLVPVR